MNKIDDFILSRAYTYEEYMEFLKELIKEGKTTGPDQNDMLVNYTRLNFQRMERLNRTIKLTTEMRNRLYDVSKKWTWVVLTEAWCGDAAQNLPILNKIASACPHIELKLLLRDENPLIMDAFLTNGGKSIPKLIWIDSNTLNVLTTWGPRPEYPQKKMMAYKANPKLTSYQSLVIEVQKWYTEDKGVSLQKEILTLMDDCSDKYRF